MDGDEGGDEEPEGLIGYKTRHEKMAMLCVFRRREILCWLEMSELQELEAYASGILQIQNEYVWSTSLCVWRLSR